MKKVKAITDAIFVEAYGLTETSPVTHMNPPSGEQKAGSIGLPLPDTQVKIVDPESGDDLSANIVGSQLVKYKVPHQIEIAEEIPRSHLNKKLHYKLRD